MEAPVPRLAEADADALTTESGARDLVIRVLPLIEALTRRAEATREWCAGR